ncbi:MULTISPECIES: Clp protease N-terminal domain-containing protein [Pseudofrankia]|uniref:Clp protease N-terminal domain-containing protein n=1 Tax=Pseudofrankia TaxID=2994363 RepID=UPI000234BC92|nr:MULTISPECIES: Clp protease N-terminal domain-containing protein [Pseudofrankia]OHV30076.1 Clp protease [Pseudofrankia sp. EUN1h]
MFERFTTQARHVVVLAQEEARELDHNYIGTEHILLGLLGETEGIAARALAEIDLSLEMTRSRVVVAVGRGKKPLKGHIPFTPRAKKVLEMSLREALALRHNYIGTEHVLLGLLELGEGLAAIMLDEWKVDSAELRARVLALIAEAGADRTAGLPPLTGSRRRVSLADDDTGVLGAEEDEPRRTAAAVAGISAANGYAGHDPVGSHHLLLALLGDPNNAATRTLTSLGLDLSAARDALLRVDLTDTSDELPEVTGRRGMSLRLTDSAVVVEATDRRLVGLARLAFAALSGHRASPNPEAEAGDDTTTAPSDPGAAPTSEAEPAAERLLDGRDPLAGSLSAVWKVLEVSLEDIRSRAATAGPSEAGPDSADGPAPVWRYDERPAEPSAQQRAPLADRPTPPERP